MLSSIFYLNGNGHQQTSLSTKFELEEKKLRLIDLITVRDKVNANKDY
jgi:hypothetical protein